MRSGRRIALARSVSRVDDGSSYLAARIAAFVAAHGAVRLCADCVAGTLPKRVLEARKVKAGWCESCGSHGSDVFRLPLAEYARALRRRTSGAAAGRSDPSTVARPTVTARCAICSGPIEAAASSRLVFRPDGRVEHGRCPDPICPWCLQTVAPSQSKLRSGRDIFHRDCLLANRSARSISGGQAASAWTMIFDERRGRHAHRDRDAFDEFRVAIREVQEDAIGLRALARAVRSASAARRTALAR
jgi:hypothetical protein